METGNQLANRFREVIFNGKWIANTNYKDQLTDLKVEIATTGLYSLNTIAALTKHLHYYVKGVKNVLEGGTLNITDKHAFDFPPLQAQIHWQNFLTLFWNDSEAFAFQVEQMPEQKLNEIFVEEKYGTFRRNIEAMIEHGYYHLGQIVLIKKILLAR